MKKKVSAKEVEVKRTATSFIDNDKFFNIEQALIEWVLEQDLEQLETLLVLQHTLDFFKFVRYAEHFRVIDLEDKAIKSSKKGCKDE